MRQLKTLSLFPGEPKPPHLYSDFAQRTTAKISGGASEVWIAVCAPELEAMPAGKLENGLRSLAIWSRTLTPTISFAPPNALLLEVQGSLRLFGGLTNIKSALVEQAESRLSAVRIAIAPTATGALWLSRHGNHESLSPTELRAQLRSLPMFVTGWPRQILIRLAEMGVNRIGDAVRLPRDGLARRIGIAYLRDLDKALGAQADLRAELELPESLSSSIDLAPETADSQLLLEAAADLFGRVTLDLQRRQRQIRGFELRFLHLHGEPSVESFELLEPAHDTQHLLGLLTHRLERIRLRAPVVAIELETGDLLDMQIGHPDLFPGAPYDRNELSIALVERLQERLGPKNVYGIALAADHRPESAWSKATVGCTSPESMSQLVRIEDRPLWLLHAPLKLRVENGRPVYRGALSLRAGPERIEGGWWDQRDISRDYFAAVGESGEKLWIYFDNVSNRWYLHGIFG